MAMKAMSVLFDLKSNELQVLPSVVHYTGYMMCAGTVYLGPFLTFQEYSNAFLRPVHWVKIIMLLLIFTYIMLICFFFYA